MEHRPAPWAPRLSRRQLLAGGAGLLFLAACGDDSTAPAPTTTTGAEGEFSLVQFFGADVLRPGSAQRAPFGLGDKDGVITAGAPASLTFRLSREGTPVGDPIVVDRHDAGLPRPYFPLVFTPDQPGTYDAVVDVGGGSAAAAFTVAPAAQVVVPQPGEAMIPVDTPTEADHHGVTPICTRQPACPLHDVTLRDALGEGRPVALLISTPKFCQVAICGPVLDVLLGEHEAFGDQVRMLHAEVYTDESASTTAPAVDAYRLSFEPCLFLADEHGTITHRLDNIFDAVELRAALTSLVA